MTVELSIITTSMNYGQYIEECIKSVIEQKADFPAKMNHLIMDGGSTDNTLKILEKYDHIHCHINKGEGQTRSLNRAMEIIGDEFPETDYVGWLNADDYYCFGWLESSLSNLKRESLDVAMTCSDHNQLIKIERHKGSRVFVEARVTHQDKSPYVDFFKLLEANSICQPTVCIKLSSFDDIKDRDGYYFNPELDFCQDYELWLRFLLHGYKIRRIRDYLATLRQHPMRLTETQGERQAVEEYNIRIAVRSRREEMKI